MATENNTGRKSSLGYFVAMVCINLILVIAVLVLALTCLSWYLDSYTRHSERVDVPSLHGVMLSDAEHYLQQVGLKPMVIDSVYADVRPGAVVEQLPAAGLPVKKGRIVYLTINALGVRMVKMLDVREGGSRQAVSTLRSLGFVVDSLRQVAHDMDDLVLGVKADGIDVVPGKEYPVGTHLVVLVGSTHMEIEPENGEEEQTWME